MLAQLCLLPTISQVLLVTCSPTNNRLSRQYNVIKASDIRVPSDIRPFGDSCLIKLVNTLPVPLLHALHQLLLLLLIRCILQTIPIRSHSQPSTAHKELLELRILLEKVGLQGLELLQLLMDLALHFRYHVVGCSCICVWLRIRHGWRRLEGRG